MLCSGLYLAYHEIMGLYYTGLKLAADYTLGHSNVQYIFQITLGNQNQNYYKR